MINKQNIAQYITFLFRQKNGQQAPEQIINSWRQIDESAIREHLQGLYNHWQMSPQESQQLEQAFLRSQQSSDTLFDIPKPNTSSHSEPQHSYQHRVSSGNPVIESRPASFGGSKGLLIGLLIGLVAVSGVASYFIMGNNSSPSDNTTHVPDLMAQPADRVIETTPATRTHPVSADTAKPLAAAATEAQSENDKANAATLQKLMDAEYKQDISTIYNTFSENMERYWGVNYPTYDDIKKLYDDSWNKRTNIKHDDVVIEKIGDNKYNVTATYSYYDLEKQKSVQKQTKTRYELDANHKIVRTYGL